MSRDQSMRDDIGGKPKDHAQEERERIERQEDEVTIDSDESFPASDPPSFNPGTAGAADVKKKKK